MSRTGAEALVAEYVEALWNRGDTSALERLTGDGFIYRLAGQPARDREATAGFVRSIRQAFPDWHVQVVDSFGGDDGGVVVRWEGEATHEGSFHGIPPTGHHVRVSGINVYRVVGGKIVAEWEQMDSLGLLQQLGAVARE